MLTHDGKVWRTECDRCHAPVEIVGVADRRRSKSGAEISKAASLMMAIGWAPLYRANAGWFVAWRCKTCVERIRNAGTTSIGFTTAAFDMRPHETKKPA